MKLVKFGLKIQTPTGGIIWYNQWIETVDDVSQPYLFNSMAAAEEFRDSHELKNFKVEEYLE